MKTQARDAEEAVRFEARIWREAYTGNREERNPETGEWKDVEVQHPASWAVYDVLTGVRIDYAKDEESAKKSAEIWSSGKMPEVIKAKVESIRYLRSILNPGDTVRTILRQVSRSGMSRRISLVIARDGEIEDITWHAARAMGDKVKQGGRWVQDAGLTVGGCGMDMGFHLVYNLGRYLFTEGFGVEGLHPLRGKLRPLTKAKAQKAVQLGYRFRGRNGDQSGWDDDGGYAFEHRWL